MNAQEIIERIRTAEKKTPVKVYLTEKAPIDFPNATVFPCGETKLVFGDWKDIQPVLDANKTAATLPSPCWTRRTSTPASSRVPSSASRWRSVTTPSS